MSPYLVGVLGAFIGAGFANYFEIAKPYYYLLILGGSVIFHSLTVRYYKNRK
jgi:hypothetical protein